MEFKYIIIDRVSPVIFTHGIEHITEAAGRNVTSAGFVRFLSDGMIECFGYSESLGIGSKREKDARLIKIIGQNNKGLGAE